MFVAPDDEIDVVIEEAFWDKFLWPMFDPGYIRSFGRSERNSYYAPILV